MKSHNNLTLFRSSLVLGLVVLVGLLGYAEPSGTPQSMDQKAMKPEMADRCHTLMAQQEKREAATKAEDAALAALVATMNSAPEKQKPALLAAIVTRMVENTTASHARMSAMQAEMMPHLMEHLSSSVPSLSACPMMKGVGSMPAEERKAQSSAQK